MRPAVVAQSVDVRRFAVKGGGREIGTLVADRTRAVRS